MIGFIAFPEQMSVEAAGVTTDLFSWAIPILGAYLLFAILAPALTRNLGRGALQVLALLPAATAVWAALLLPEALNGGVRRLHLEWVPALSLGIDLRWDALSAVLTLVVSTVGALVLLYSARYFPPEDDGAARYAAALTAFAGAMIALVLADNLILLVISWELTGLLSYVLIALRAGKQSARRSAMQAFIVTTAGGLAMLIGAVMLGELSGSYLISDLLSSPPRGTGVSAAVVLMLVGGLSKSAIFPFQFWLPGAMAAPTPASAYLHAATMVKAGVYLFARFAPAFGALAVWQPLLIGLGGITVIYGAITALRQRDLKLLLAYGTVSQLGLMTLLLGAGNADALLAGLAMLVAHATFKAALFFVVGMVDTAAGTRDLTQLTGLAKLSPLLFWLSVLAALSMAGVPPMIGFATKEAGYAGLLEGGTWGVVALILMVIGSLLTVAYSARFVWGAFSNKANVTSPITTGRFSLPLLMIGPTMLLVLIGLVLGIAPQLLEPLVASYAGSAGALQDNALALWHGFNLPLALSAAAWVGGAGLFWWQRRRESLGSIAMPGGEPGAVYRRLMAMLDNFAVRFTGLTQRGSLPVSLGSILLVLLIFPGSMLISAGITPGEIELFGSPAELLLCLIVATLAVVTLRAKRGLSAVLLVGGVGYAVAVLFILRGAPDLALTQLLVETITLVAALLVLSRLPDTALYASHRGNKVRLALAVAVGALMTALALILPGVRNAAPISEQMAKPAKEFGGGSNVVNVILVDIRGWDTFGELLVLVSAATGVASLVFLARRTGSAPRRPSAAGGYVAKPAAPSPWLATNWSPRRSLLLEVGTRLIFHTMVVFSLYVLFVGHDQPGGGFAAGLIVGLALTLRYIAGGAFELGEAAPWDVGRILGLGVFLAVASAAGGILLGGEALQSTILEADIPILGHFKFVTSSIFDIGVYLVVIGLVLDVLRSLGAGLDRQANLDRIKTERDSKSKAGAR